MDRDETWFREFKFKSKSKSKFKFKFKSACAWLSDRGRGEVRGESG